MRFLAGVFAGFCVVLAGCAEAVIPDETVTPDEPIVPKRISITNFPGPTYQNRLVMVTLFPSLTSEKITAVGALLTLGCTILTFLLEIDKTPATDWTGMGEYYCLLLAPQGILKRYLYTQISQPKSRRGKCPKAKFYGYA
jgi:hypothetical protein